MATTKKYRFIPKPFYSITIVEMSMKCDFDTDRVLSVGKASMRSGLTKNRIRLLCDLGILKYFRMGQQRRISMRSLDAYMEKLYAGEIELPPFPKNKKKDALKKAKETGDLDPIRDWSVD